MGLLQLKRLTSATIIETFQVNGTPTDLDSGNPTVTVTRPDGTTIAPGTISHPGTGQYSFVLAGQPECTVLTVTWTGTIGGQSQTLESTVEIVGNDLFTIPQFRGLKIASGYPFAATATPLFTTQQIMDKRTEILDEMQHHLGFPPVPRFQRVTLDGAGGSTIVPTDGVLKEPRLISIKINGTAGTVGNYAFTAASTLVATSNYTYGTAFTAGLGNVVVELVHGWPRMMGKGSNIAMLWVAAELLPSGFTNTASVTTPDGVVYTYEPSGTARSGFTNFTGIKAIDRWLNDWSEVVPGSA